MSQTSMERARAAVVDYAKKHGIGNSLTGHDPAGEPEGFVTDPSGLKSLHASTDILVRDMAAMLVRHWPGFRWAIQPSEFGKVFNIFCLDFSGRWGYRIKYTDIMHDPKRRELMKAGRELLRRFYPGTIYKPELIAALMRNSKGEAIPDVSDLKASRFTQRAKIELALADGSGRVIGSKGTGSIIEIKQ